MQEVRNPAPQVAGPDELGPEQIVARARQFIAANLRIHLKPSTIARAIGVSAQDLVGSYTCATITSLNKDIARLRLQAFHTLIHRAPEASLHSLAAQAGLQMGERLQQDFKQEFLVSIEEHRRHCYRRHRSQA